MARTKSIKNKLKKPKKAVKKQLPPKVIPDPLVEEVYEEEIEFLCPIRGLIKQKIKVKRYKSLMSTINPKTETTDIIKEVEEKDDGLSIYDSTEEE